ncbi:trihelix transcription factor GT-1-like isoform X2 [Magnolia sinica]|uniref:trihelix transcription factor GT-1-like isoform X2 n=1 Tax=Magnolia sinica TaxID=86752 RepID=UPI00265A8F88|nr:trihelix transcription factor GT-1-like isoform X2 [Magnolia sinica]
MARRCTEISTLSALTADMESLDQNLERSIINEVQSISPVMPQECHLQNGRNVWSWRDGDCVDVPVWDSGMDCHPAIVQPPAGRVIIVKWGDMARKVGIDGSADAIKAAIRSAFGLRSKRTFWVEDEDGVVRSFDRTMPQTTYTLHIDPGVTIKLYHYDECSRQTTNSEDATLYSEDDFRELLARYGWQSLREVGTCKDVESIQELRPMASYHSSYFKDMSL